jgi:UMF1 family MFS transporter
MEQPPRHHLQPPFSLRQQSSAHFSSRSAEADDERSYPSSYTSSMDSSSLDDEADLSPPSYNGEDTRPTSRKELAGFYAYSFAAEVFVICGLGAFIPITLEDLARGSPTAVLASDHTKSCRTKLDIPEVAATLSAYGNSGRKHANNQCVFLLFGLEINTASFAMYTFSISVLLQALVVVTMSGAADHGKFRKTMLLTFAVVGAVATMLFLPITPNAYLLGSLWAIIGNVCFGASFVLLNSFLPLLVRHHPKILGRSEGRNGRSREPNEVGHIISLKRFIGPTDQSLFTISLSVYDLISLIAHRKFIRSSSICRLQAKSYTKHCH